MINFFIIKKHKMDGANMQEIVKMAQQVASNITQNKEHGDLNGMDMSKMISQVTESVSKMVTPDFIEKMTSGNMADIGSVCENIVPGENSKINLGNQIEEIGSDSEMDSLAPKTKDLHFTLNVTLEELYSGKTKRLAVRRKRLISDGKTKKVVDEKKKIIINIEPGMFDEQVLTFNKQADEREGYETGDIIITLCCAEHDDFERENNNLIVEKDISLYEAYDCNMTITHLDGREININSNQINVFGDELECYRKLKGYGMPIYGSENEYGDLIVKFKPVLPDKFSTEQLGVLENLFPKINTTKTSDVTHELEMVTESDFEYSDSESNDSESDSEDEIEELDSESDSESESEEKKDKDKGKSKSKK